MSFTRSELCRGRERRFGCDLVLKLARKSIEPRRFIDYSAKPTSIRPPAKTPRALQPTHFRVESLRNSSRHIPQKNQPSVVVRTSTIPTFIRAAYIRTIRVG